MHRHVGGGHTTQPRRPRTKMSPELAALAALFKPQMTCVVRQSGKAVDTFSSVNSSTPDGLLLYQRNYEPGFSEIIVYAYDAGNRRYVRTQLENGGAYAVATSPGPVNGIWDWTVHASLKKYPVLHWERKDGVSRFWVSGKRWVGECK
jgi:hypothetical protein